MTKIEFPYDNHGKWKYYEIKVGFSKFHEKDVYDILNKQTKVVEHSDPVLFLAIQSADELDTKLHSTITKNGMSAPTRILDIQH